MTVESKDATLSTMTVTIQAIQVGNKQMTISVFRQLPEMNMIGEGGNITTGLDIWGFVRHQLKDGPDEWFIGSHEGSLYRVKNPNLESVYSLEIEAKQIKKRISQKEERLSVMGEYGKDKLKIEISNDKIEVYEIINTWIPWSINAIKVLDECEEKPQLFISA